MIKSYFVATYEPINDESSDFNGSVTVSILAEGFLAASDAAVAHEDRFAPIGFRLTQILLDCDL
jgi:hypothetical protein